MAFFYTILCLKPIFRANLQQPISRGNNMFEDFSHSSIIEENLRVWKCVWQKVKILCEEPIFYAIMLFQYFL